MGFKIKKSIALILMLALCLSLFIAFTACNNEDSTPLPTFQKASDSADGYATVFMPSDGSDINIMVLSDPQVDTSEKYNIVGSLGTDKTYSFIEDFVTASKPDLVIINGDMVMSTLPNNAPYFTRYAELFEKLNTPWMPVFGNHDSENGWTNKSTNWESEYWQVSKNILVEYLSSYEHCLMTSDKDCADGDGNYFVNIRKHDGSLAYTMCAFDCVYNPEYGGLLSGDNSYLYTPTANQVSWYKNTIIKLSDAEYGTERNENKVVKSMIFNHVGIPEFKTAWDMAWNNGSPNENYYYGRWFDGDYTDKYADMPENEQIFAVAKALGSTTAIFMAHHHDNDFSVDYQGIRLTFGQNSGVSHSYRTSHSANGTSVREWRNINFSCIDDYGNQRGGTTVTISNDGEFDIQPVYAEILLANFFSDYYIDYDVVATTLEQNPDYSTGTVIRGTKRAWKRVIEADA